MSSQDEFLSRRACHLVTEALADTRIVVVNGARQVGKSTLAKAVLRQHPGAVARFLDEPRVQAAAVEDPMRFLRHDGLMLIDEVQRVPELWLAMKYLVDQEPRPGRFLLTGSARLMALSQLSDSLIGRKETIELWPLSQGEIDSAQDGFVDAAFALGADLFAPASEERRKDYLARASRGGFPQAWRRATPRRRQSFFEEYLADLMVRDIKQVADIERAADMRKLIALLAAQVSGVFNASRFADRLDIAVSTVRHYVEILETIYLIRLVPGWRGNTGTRAVAAPKVTFVDSGLAAYLSGRSETSAGALIENLVLGELARQLTWSETPAQLYHFRDRDQYEVDAVLEDYAGRVIGIEVKAAETVRSEDFRGLRRLQRRLGDRFLGGYVLYCGSESLPFGPGLNCLPISALWTTPSP